MELRNIQDQTQLNAENENSFEPKGVHKMSKYATKFVKKNSNILIRLYR